MNKNSEQNLPTKPKTDINIRPASQADVGDIGRIARVTWDATYNATIAAENRREFLQRAYKPENLAEAIDANGHWFYIVDQLGQAVAFGHFLRRYHPSQSRAELVRLYVLPEYQNLGWGEKLLRRGFSDLAKDNIEQCFVSVQESNHKAQKFYERHGFVYHRKHGQFLGTQIVTLVEYIRPIIRTDIITD